MKKFIVLFFLIGSLCGEMTIDPTRIADKRSVVHVLVIGSGPAGYAAAVHAARAGFVTKVLAGVLPGGQLTETGFVENWPGIKKARGAAIMDEQQQQVLDAGATIVEEVAVSINASLWPFEVTTNKGNVYRALTIVMATGSAPCTLGIPGEKKYWGNGVSVCAVCDARFFADKDVMVVGGGDSAAEQALQLAAYARRVTVLVRGAAMRANWSMQQKLAQTLQVRVECNKELASINGDNDSVTCVTVCDTLHKNTEQRAIDGVFLAIGHTPRSQVAPDQVARDEHGYIVLNGRSQATSLTGFFAAGEVADPDYRLAAVAAGDGCKAGRDAERFLYAYGLTPQVVNSWKQTSD